MIRKYIHIVLLLGLFIVSHRSIAGLDLDFMNSPEFSTMMEEFERELASLSPEEREAFDEMMTEFARVVQEMPEEEFNQLLEDISKDMQTAEEMGIFEPAESADALVSPVEPAAPIIRVEIPDEIKELAEILQNIKTHLALFIAKLQIAPDLTLKIDKWIAGGKISGIPVGYNWIQVVETLETVTSLITIMLETDATSKPVFLFDIHTDASLEESLMELASTLREVPSLDFAEFGMKQEKETNAAIQRILSELFTEIFSKNVLQKLQAISLLHQGALQEKGILTPQTGTLPQQEERDTFISEPAEPFFEDFE